MKKIYYFLFYCFYTIFLKKDTEKVEGATSLLTILITSIIFSISFLIRPLFELKFYYPNIELSAILIMCIIIWLLNRNFFIKNKQADNAIRLNQDKSKTLCKAIGIFLSVGQIILFITSGIITGKYMRGV